MATFSLANRKITNTICTATLLALVLSLTAVASASEIQEPQAAGTKTMVTANGDTILVSEGLRGTAPTIDEIMRTYVGPEEYDQPPRAIINPSVTEPIFPNRPWPVAESDPAARPPAASRAPAAALSFGGYDSSDNVSQGLSALFPPDTNGDVGSVYYVQYNNIGWKYFNKSDGSLAGGPFPGNSFWQGSTLPASSPCVTNNAGDPIVLYDHLAREWVFSQFVSPTTNSEGHQCFAITVGGNPAGPYFVYDFVIGPAAPNGEFNDYEKIGLWSDGGAQSAYHMSSNQFSLPGLSILGIRATAFERDAMLTGGSALATSFFKSLFTDPSATGHVPFTLQPAHLEGPKPPTGRCALYLQLNDGAFTGQTGTEPDGYQFWEYCADFVAPFNPTFTEGPFVASAAFTIPGGNVSQPGTAVQLGVLRGRAMYRFSTRMIDGALEGVVSHDIDAGGGQHSVRYSHFSLPSLAGVSLTDQGTFSPPDSQSRWMPAAGLDSQGDIALVYSRSGGSAGQFPSVYFTGRETGATAGTLQTESVCVDGTGIQTGTQNGVGRWGDYASVSMDPVDDCTFWMTNEYVQTTGSVDWDTQICSFSFPSCQAAVSCKIGIYRPGTRQFLLDVNGSGTFSAPPDQACLFGIAGDTPIIGDWNGDGDDQLGVYRPSSRLFLLDVDENCAYSAINDETSVFGASGDVPIVGDWNGDGDDDIGIYRPSNRLFRLDFNEDGVFNVADDIQFLFGLIGDVPLVGDWNEDGDDDIGIYRPSNRVFLLDTNENNVYNPGVDTGLLLGLIGDLPLVGDWNGDGDDQIGVYRPSNRLFLLDLNEDGVWMPGPDLGFIFGLVGDTPIIGSW